MGYLLIFQIQRGKMVSFKDKLGNCERPQIQRGEKKFLKKFINFDYMVFSLNNSFGKKN